MNEKLKKSLCGILAGIMVLTGGIVYGRKTGKNEGYSKGYNAGISKKTEDILFSLNGLADNINEDILCLLQAKYNLLQKQGIDEEEKAYSIANYYVLDIENEIFSTFGLSPVYAYIYIGLFVVTTVYLPITLEAFIEQFILMIIGHILVLVPIHIITI